MIHSTSTDTTLIHLLRAAFPFDDGAAPAGDAAGLDWHSVIERAKAHGLAALLYVAIKQLALQDRVPADLLAALRRRFLLTDVASWRVYQELGRLLERFEREQIPVVLLKGCALGPTLYASIRLRQLSDLDLLIPAAAKERASALMLAQGFSIGLDLTEHFRDHFASEQSFARSGAVPVAVDLHWHICNVPYFRTHVPMEWFWQRTVAVDVDGRRARIFAPSAQLLHLSFHWWLHHRGDGLKWSYDIALLLARYRAQIDWDETIAAARTFGLVQPLRATLSQVSATWGVNVPESIFARLRPSLKERVAFAMLTARQIEARSVWDVFNVGGWRARAVYLFRIFFPSPSFMRARYRFTSPWLLPAYYGYRWLRGLTRFVQSAGSMLANILRTVARAPRTG